MIDWLQNAVLAVLALTCWLGCIGMLRMRNATQALHYVSLPSSIAAPLLPLAVWCVTGWSVATLKAGLIALFLLASNSVVAHATARAFRVRKLGHWQPREGDRLDYLDGSEPQ